MASRWCLPVGSTLANFDEIAVAVCLQNQPGTLSNRPNGTKGGRGMETGAAASLESRRAGTPLRNPTQSIVEFSPCQNAPMAHGERLVHGRFVSVSSIWQCV
jgi:hypothetical protein